MPSASPTTTSARPKSSGRSDTAANAADPVYATASAAPSDDAATAIAAPMKAALDDDELLGVDVAGRVDRGEGRRNASRCPGPARMGERGNAEERQAGEEQRRADRAQASQPACPVAPDDDAHHGTGQCDRKCDQPDAHDCSFVAFALAIATCHGSNARPSSTNMCEKSS